MSSRHTHELPPTRPARVRIDSPRASGGRSSMPTATPIPSTTPPAQLSRTDLTAGIVSMLIAIAAILGLVPIGLTGEEVIALGTGIATVVALGRALWERRAELNRQTVLAQVEAAKESYRETLAAVQARHAADVAKLTAVADLVKRAANPKDATALSPEALLDLLRDYGSPAKSSTSMASGAFEGEY